MGDILGNIILVLNQSRLIYLTNSNYNQNCFLKDFYKDLSQLIDKFVESYIGYKKQKIYININSSDSESFSNIEELCDFSIKNLEELKTFVSADFLKNIIDEMIECTAGLIYKCKFL